MLNIVVTAILLLGWIAMSIVDQDRNRVNPKVDENKILTVLWEILEKKWRSRVGPRKPNIQATKNESGVKNDQK